MARLLLALCLALVSSVAVVIPGAGRAEARTCSTWTGTWATTARCWDGDESYRRCLLSTTYRLVCGGWRPGDYSASTAAIPCCSTGNREVIRTAWTEWRPR